MRAATTALVSYINTLRAEPDAQAIVADCYTFTLLTGLIMTYTNADVPVTRFEMVMRPPPPLAVPPAPPANPVVSVELPPPAPPDFIKLNGELISVLFWDDPPGLPGAPPLVCESDTPPYQP